MESSGPVKRVMTGTALRRARMGRQVVKPLWSRIPLALQLSNVFRSAVGRQLRRTSQGAASRSIEARVIVRRACYRCNQLPVR